MLRPQRVMISSPARRRLDLRWRTPMTNRANRALARALGSIGLSFAAALAAVLPAAAQDKVQLQLNWFHLADHSPIYLALKKGYYKEEGIELTVLRGSGSADSAKKIELGQSDIGIADAPTVLTAIGKGANLKMVAVVYDKAGNNVFFRKAANIKAPKDLVGKKIAVPPADSHRVLWPAFAALHGIDPNSVTLVNVKPEGKQAIVAANEVDASFDLYTSYAIWPIFYS
jgi:NitT/TauT family transport system substrate-binding protein